MVAGIVDQAANVLGRLPGAQRQRPHLRRHDGEAAAGVARPRGLDAGVERQQIGLERDFVDEPDDLRNLFRARRDLAHRRNRLVDHRGAAPGVGVSRSGEVARISGALRGALRALRDLVE